MALTIGIVGLPNVGKSTLFNALTRNRVLAANYPFATIESNLGTVPLSDSRLEDLAKIYGSQRIIPATVTFVDIAGIVAGASQGEGLGNQFLANIREADALAQVVRVFGDAEVVHVRGEVDPGYDLQTVNTELMLADLQTLDKVIPRLEKEAKNTHDTAELESAKAAKKCLEAGRPLSVSSLDLASLKSYGLLTAKPVIYVFNLEQSVLGNSTRLDELRALVEPAPSIFLDAQLESELVELSQEEASQMLVELGLSESGLSQLARESFALLGLQTYLTAGPKEARAWTIHRGDKAPRAAGVIHTDFEKKFIKAEIIGFDELLRAGSLSEARSRGLLRLEGKDYVMQDGDVVEFRHGG